MDTKRIMELEKRILTFQSEIAINNRDNAQEVLRYIISKHPEMVYYLRKCSFSGRGTACLLHMEYMNQSYPTDRIYVIKQCDLEDVLRQSIMNYEKKVVLVLPANANFQWIMQCFMTRSISFYPNTKSYSVSSFEFEDVPFTAYELLFYYHIGTVMLKRMELEVSQKLIQLRHQLFPVEMPDSAKCFIAHNYLACTAEYYDVDKPNPLERSYIQSAYGALIRGKCVCQGFAEAYKRILNDIGIPCDLVSGKILTGDGEWHAWNIVHLNQNRIHCHVDVTWDSNFGYSEKTYFLKSDSFFEGKREWKRHYYTPCSDGDALLREARIFCAFHKKELLKSGFRGQWIT